MVAMGLLASPARPAAAQWLGMPVWNSPKGGTGVTINGEFGKPNDAYGAGTAWAGRASLGVGTLTLTAGVASYRSDSIGPDWVTSWGGDAAFRLIGGSLLPVAVNLQAGAARTGAVELGKRQTYVTGALGLSVLLPTPGVSIEPYFSPGIRYRNFGSGNGSDTNVGFVVGANLSFGVLGVHGAYDYEKAKDGELSVFGLGAHVALKVPLGM